MNSAAELLPYPQKSLQAAVWAEVYMGGCGLHALARLQLPLWCVPQTTDTTAKSLS